MNFDKFSYLEKLMKINLRETFLQNFSFIDNLSIYLKEIDLSNNQKLGNDLLFLKRYKNIEILKLSNTNLTSFDYGIILPN